MNANKEWLEKLEDEYDLAVYQEAHDEWVKDGMQSRPIEELWKELDLEDEQDEERSDDYKKR